jgi:streptomycin 6-kinase
MTLLQERVPPLIKLWGLTDLSPLPCGPHVFKGYQPEKSREVVLKLAGNAAEFNQEVLTLQHYQGSASVELFAMDAAHQGILMEYVHPGLSLKDLFPQEDTGAVKIAAELIECLHQLPLNNPHDFPKLANWLEIFKHPRNQVLPKPLLDKAIQLSAALLNSTTKEVLLHADLHHQNILSSDRAGYLAVDPHGVVGDPAFEIATFMRNPIPEIINISTPELKDLLKQRLTLFAKLLNFDKERLQAWAYVGTMLSAAWSIQDQQPFTDALHIAALLA